MANIEIKGLGKGFDCDFFNSKKLRKRMILFLICVQKRNLFNFT